MVHSQLLGMLEPEEKHGPNLRVGFLEEETEASLGNTDTAVFAFGVDEGSHLEKLPNVGGGVLGTEK